MTNVSVNNKTHNPNTQSSLNPINPSTTTMKSPDNGENVLAASLPASDPQEHGTTSHQHLNPRLALVSLPDLSSSDGLSRSRLYPYINENVPQYEHLDDGVSANEKKMDEIIIPESLSLDEDLYQITLEHAKRLDRLAKRNDSLKNRRRRTLLKKSSMKSSPSVADMPIMKMDNSVPPLQQVPNVHDSLSLFHLTQVSWSQQHQDTTRRTQGVASKVEDACVVELNEITKS